MKRAEFDKRIEKILMQEIRGPRGAFSDREEENLRSLLFFMNEEINSNSARLDNLVNTIRELHRRLP